MRHGDYPPPRGACLSVGDRRYLYTTGYVPSLGRYPHGHVPTPVQITGHVGDSSAKALLAEVLLMTKMNWNSARFAEKLPVTLRFANEVGTILRDLPDDYAPEARYAFYPVCLLSGMPSTRYAFYPVCLLYVDGESGDHGRCRDSACPDVGRVDRDPRQFFRRPGGYWELGAVHRLDAA